MLALAYLRPEEDQSIWSKHRQGFQPCCETLGFVLRGEECTVYTDLWFCLLLFVVVLHYYLLLYLVVTAVSAVILSSMSGDH